MKQRRARVRFAKDHKDWTKEDSSKVIFHDESDCRLMVRHRPREAKRPTSHRVFHQCDQEVDGWSQAIKHS